MKSNRSQLNEDVKLSAMAALETNDDLLIRKLCRRILNESSPEQEESKSNKEAVAAPAHTACSLKNKIARRQKFLHRTRGARLGNVNKIGAPSPTDQPASRSATNIDSPTGKLIIVEDSQDDTVSVLSRVLDKRFYSPKMDKVEAQMQEQPVRSATPDFLKYKGSASFNCFRKEVRDDQERERSEMNVSRALPRPESPFSFESQSTQSSTGPPLRSERNPVTKTTFYHQLGLSKGVNQTSRWQKPDSVTRTTAGLPKNLARGSSSPATNHTRYSPIPRVSVDHVQVGGRKPGLKQFPVPSCSTQKPASKPTTQREKATPSPSAGNSLYTKAVRNPHKGASAFAPYRTTDTPTTPQPRLGASPMIPRTSSDAENHSARFLGTATPVDSNNIPTISQQKATIARVLCDSPSNRTSSPFLRHRASPLHQRDFTIRQTSPTTMNKTEASSEERFTSRPLHLSSGAALRGSSERSEASNSATSRMTKQQTIAKSSLRLQHSTAFAKEIELYRSGQVSYPVPSSDVSAERSRGLSVYVRKRPVLRRDLDKGNIDVLHLNKETLASGRKTVKSTSVTIFRTNVTGEAQATKLIQPLTFGCFANVFDHSVDGDRVYRTAVKPLVQSALKHHRPATLLIYGQTGSGRSYTMQECQKLIATEIFSSHARGELQCLKLVGKKCIDLLSVKSSSVVSVVNEGDSVQLVGAQKITVNSARSLLSAFEQCEKRRKSQSAAGRGHVVYQIRLSRGGVLTLVSCSGAERRVKDSDNNGGDSSLFSLKECIRVRTQSLGDSKDHRIPYRASNLTRVLRECLENKHASISAIGTLSPNATDTEDSIGTLKMVSNLIGNSWYEGDSRKINTKKPVEKPLVAPKDWGHEELTGWMSKRDLVGRKPIPCHLDGKAVMKMSRNQLESALYNGDADADTKSTRLFRSLRHESERVMRSDLRRKMTIVGMAN